MIEGLRKIKVIPLAAESFGVRSTCTYVQTSDVKVLIDPGTSLGRRFNLLPHPSEYRAIVKCRERVAKYADKAEIVTSSHYHFDHNTPTYTDYVWNWCNQDIAMQIYKDKTVLAKDIQSLINASQRRRGWIFRKTARRFMKNLEVADGRTFSFGKTRLKFSEPVFHGEKNTPLGWVLMLIIECNGESIIHASDVQGPALDETLKMILTEKPKLVFMSGPPLYLSGFRVSEKIIKHSIGNLIELVNKVPVVILEHHLLRDQNWRKYAEPVFKAAQRKGHMVVTAAEFTGKQDNTLEFRRMDLYREEPPSESFLRWSRLPRLRQKVDKPPI